MFTNYYLDWILPLLYPPEEEVLLKYVRMSKRGFGLRRKSEAMKEMKLTRRRLDAILWKLEFLTRLYELQVAAGLHDSTTQSF